MKTVLISLLATALLGSSALASPVSPRECLIVCVEPEQHDPNAAASCNCAERFCPSGPEVPVGEVFGWDEAINACGPVLPGDQCAGLDVTCKDGYQYGWNGVDTCQCLPVDTKRFTPPICEIACILPSEHDPNAVPTGCNCEKEFCPPHQGPGGLEIPAGDVYAFNATSHQCGPVPDAEAECESLGVTCVDGYSYGWSESDTACECIPEYVSKRASDIICDIVCINPDEHDPNAIPTDCNCAERFCPPGPECAVNTSFGWDQEAGTCGCVTDQNAECAATETECVSGYTYGWDVDDTTCKCLPDTSSKKRG